MKTELASVDVHILVGELDRELKGSRIDKVYQIGRKLRVKLRQREQELVIAPNFICLSSFTRKPPTQPPSFAMQLRKHLSGGVIKKVEQHNFDRIALVTVERSEKTHTLVVELFSKGNVVLCEGKKIIGLMEWQKWKDRMLGVGQEYQYPPEVANPLTVERKDFESLLKAEKSVAATLATGLSLGGLYAEEICLNAKTDKSKKCSELDEKELDRLYSSFSNFIETLKSGKVAPLIVLKDEKEIDVAPFELGIYKGDKTKTFKTFNQAVDEYFGKREMEEAETLIDDKHLKRLKKLETIKSKQEETISDMRIKVEECKKAGDLIFQHLQEIQSVVSEIKEARKKSLSDEEIVKRFDRVKSLDKNKLVLNFDI